MSQTPMQKLLDYAFNVYSQFGEDGIIEKIFTVIGTVSRISVEFGAWDGFYHSNTANLWTHGWTGVLIEADQAKCDELIKNTVIPYKCTVVHRRVEPAGRDALEQILSNEHIPDDIDLLSIDIDGDDYYILAGLNRLKPRVIVCEYNPTIPPDVELVSRKGNYFGCSSLSLVKLAKTKGYELVSMTDTNCIFVQASLISNFTDYDTDIRSLFPRQHLTYLISDYSGKYLLSRQPTYGWTLPSSQEFLLGTAYYPKLNIMVWIKQRLKRALGIH